MTWHRNFAAFYQDILKTQASSDRSLIQVDKLVGRFMAADLGAFQVGVDDVMAKDAVILSLEAPANEDEVMVESDDITGLDDDGEDGGVGSASGEESTAPLFDSGAYRARQGRAARKIQRTQVQDPYNRQTTLGVAILRARRGNRRVIGPLLYWEVDLEYHPSSRRLVATRRSPIPELNTTLIEPLLEEHEAIGEVVDHVRKHLVSENFGPNSLPTILKTIAGLVDALEPIGKDPLVSDRPLATWMSDPGVSIPSVLHGAILANAPKSNAHLIEDLRRLEALEAPPPGSPLDLITREEGNPTGSEPPPVPFSFDDTESLGERLHFPFESNPAQRRVAGLAGRARLMAVQGPPGTGKSHTIANLVCHLAARGKSVLVTSHQRKAIEVVSERLEPIPGLALSVASGDRSTTLELANRIEAFVQADNLQPDTASEAVRRGESAMDDLDRELRELARRFGELREKEHRGWEDFRTYESLREWDRIDPDDRPYPEQWQAIADSLPRWCELISEVGDLRDELAALVCPHGPESTSAIGRRIVANLDELVRLGLELQDAPPAISVVRVKEALAEEGLQPDSETRDASTLLTWIDGEGAELIVAAEQLKLRELDLELWIAAARALGAEVLEELHRGATAAQKKLTRQPDTPSLLDRIRDPIHAEGLEEHVPVLETGSRSLLRWILFPAVRRARKWATETLGREVTRASVARLVAGAEEARVDLRARREMKDVHGALSHHLPPGFRINLPDIVTGTRVDWEMSARQVTAALKALSRVIPCPVGTWTRVAGALGLDPPQAANRSRAEVLDRHLRAVMVLGERDEVLGRIQTDTPLSTAWQDRIVPLVSAIQAASMDDAGSAALVDLQESLNGARIVLQLRDLERGELASIERTRAQLSESLLESAETPAWIAEGHVEDALKAHQLGGMIRGSLSVDPDDIQSVSTGLRKGQQKRLRWIARLVERKHVLRQAKARAAGTTRADLQAILKLLRVSGRMRQSLVAQRERIRYDSVLSAFPVWLATIDDACRLFPPTDGLFDYVIVDEASQCPQPALLPIALRARNLIVVGDRKQLRPTLSRFVSVENIEALKSKHGLMDHPASLFSQGKDSLLDLVEFRSSHSGFLDEHFRCDPAIIAWSNGRYYSDRLKILTHRRDNAFRPALEVRQLQDADDDPERKVNEEEAKAIVREVRRLTGESGYVKMTVGVISPFRKQADLIQALLEREFRDDPHIMRRHAILASTADGFQGDERDIVLYSLRMGPSSNPNSLGVLEREEERFNVAFSRARRLGITFLSAPIDRLPSSGVTRSWVDHALRVERGEVFHADGSGADQFDSEFERKVCGRLRDRGLTVTTQVPCGPFRIDLVARDVEGRELAIECDGQWKSDEFGHLRPEDYQRQDLIERAGWTVYRISGRRYLLNPGAEIDQVLETLDQQATAEERSIWSGERILPAEEAAALEEEKADPETHGDPATAAQEREATEATEGEEVTAAPAVEEGPLDEVSPLDADSPEPPQAQTVLGRSVDDIRPALRGLIRWTLLSSHSVRGPMFDRLMEVDSRLQANAQLVSADIEALEFIHKMASKEGFSLDGEA